MFFLVWGILFGFTVSIFAEADGPDFWQVRDPVAITLHESTRLDATAIATIPAGTKGLKNLGCEGAVSYEEWSRMSETEQQGARDRIWCKVSYADQIGWVQNKHLVEYSVPSAPSFDCAKAEGEVENLICKDPELMNLDNMMSVVYLEALNKASAIDDQPDLGVRNLKATQRGWIKGRNECWKALTDKTNCTESEYKRRISYLQVKWGLIAPGETKRFQCEDKVEEFFITFYSTELLPSAAVEYGDNRKIFVATPTASGIKYVGDFGRYVWIKEEEAAFVWDQNRPSKLCRTASQ